MWKAFPDDYSMRVAFWLMCKKLSVSAKTYEKIKSNLQIPDLIKLQISKSLKRKTKTTSFRRAQEKTS